MKHTFKFISLFFCITLRLSAQDIFDAARKGDIVRMEALYKLKPDTLNSRNETGFTPLILAVYRNQINAAEYLISHKADVNATSPEGPALLAACYKGNSSLAELLIQNRADVNACNSQGTSALMYAALSNSTELVKLLLKHGAKKDLVEKSGKTALSYAKIHESPDLIALLSE